MGDARGARTSAGVKMASSDVPQLVVGGTFWDNIGPCLDVVATGPVVCASQARTERRRTHVACALDTGCPPFGLTEDAAVDEGRQRRTDGHHRYVRPSSSNLSLHRSTRATGTAWCSDPGECLRSPP